MNSKKNLQQEINSKLTYELFFFDESRFGTHSKIGHGWFETGKRTQVKISLGFKNFYVYSALSSKTGDNFHLILPLVNTDCMNTYLQEFSIFLKDRKAIIVLDGASWHKSQDLIVPSNIQLITLPAYSPELNPTERLWEYLKNHILKNKIYECISSLEDAVCRFLNGLTNEQIMQTCNCNYLII